MRHRSPGGGGTWRKGGDSKGIWSDKKKSPLGRLGVSILSWVGNAEVLADFLYEVVLHLGMPRNRRHSACFSIHIKAVSASFPGQRAVIATEVCDEGITFHANSSLR